jgi:ferredoxin-NADP reductase
MWNWQTATVIDIQQAAPATRRFFLRVDGIEHFDFKAGQFITLDLPVSTKRLQRWRSYSIASAPDGTNVIELCIVRLDGGLGTNYLFEEVTVGSSLTFKGADGAFVLPAVLPPRIVMIATGTGVAPFRSMIKTIFDNNMSQNNQIHLIFGTRTADGILYKDELEALARERTDFNYSVALSREKTENYHFGYVHALYQTDFYKNNLSDTHFFLCGWKNMIDDALAQLRAMNVPDNQIHYELYG